MKRFMKYVQLAGLAALLAGCAQPTTYNQWANLEAAPMGVDGRWVDANGIVSSFKSGAFETRTPDTREKLADGKYVFTRPNLINLHMRSLVRGTVSSVSCALSNDGSQLLCTQESGAQFSLKRTQ